ncbi:hypothetical protein [Methylobacterium sp. WL6]|uniref:hypothetical protein n=1 Tax=Methylobacterium sp. WL6 TaxID=2603901 RepID=UPI00164F7732|nr:hypothetical protein [Methylobacterium sp. WL6]
MITVLAFVALEWSAAALAVAAAVYAAATGSLLITGISAAAAIVAGFLRAIAFGRATARRSDDMLAGLRPVLRPANDERGAS